MFDICNILLLYPTYITNFSIFYFIKRYNFLNLGVNNAPIKNDRATILSDISCPRLAYAVSSQRLTPIVPVHGDTVGSSFFKKNSTPTQDKQQEKKNGK